MYTEREHAALAAVTHETAVQTPDRSGRGDIGGDGFGGTEAEGAVRRADAKAGAVNLGQVHHQGMYESFFLFF